MQGDNHYKVDARFRYFLQCPDPSGLLVMHPYSFCQTRAGLWHRHCRQMPRVYDVKEAYERKMAAKYFEHMFYAL